MKRFLTALFCMTGLLQAVDPACEELFKRAKAIDMANFDNRDGKDHQEEKSKASADFMDLLGTVDRKKIATKEDIESIFKSLLYRHFNLGSLDLKSLQGKKAPQEQLKAYQIMDAGCQVLLGFTRDEPISYNVLVKKTLLKLGDPDITEGNAKNLIPTSAIEMITPRGGGTLLGKYNKEETLKAIQKEKYTGKAIYMILGRGNRQIVQEGQKTPDGKDIAWVYVDRDPQTHSPFRGYYFCESFGEEGKLWDGLPKDFFDGVIFDNGGTVKMLGAPYYMLIDVRKIAIGLTPKGFMVMPPEMPGGGHAVIFKDIPSENWERLKSEYKINDDYDGTGVFLPKYPKTGNPSSFPDPNLIGTKAQFNDDEEYNRITNRMNEDYKKQFKVVLESLFNQVERIENDKDLGFNINNPYLSTVFRASKPIK